MLNYLANARSYKIVSTIELYFPIKKRVDLIVP